MNKFDNFHAVAAQAAADKERHYGALRAERLAELKELASLADYTTDQRRMHQIKQRGYVNIKALDLTIAERTNIINACKNGNVAGHWSTHLRIWFVDKDQALAWLEGQSA